MPSPATVSASQLARMTPHDATRTSAEPANRRDRIAQRLADIARHSPSRVGLFRTVYHGRPSKALALKAKCLDCSGWQVAEIRDCPSVTCPLWRVRPYQSGPLCPTEARGERSSERTRSGRVRIAEGA